MSSWASVPASSGPEMGSHLHLAHHLQELRSTEHPSAQRFAGRPGERTLALRISNGASGDAPGGDVTPNSPTPDLSPQPAGSPVLDFRACGAKPVSLGPLGVANSQLQRSTICNIIRGGAVTPCSKFRRRDLRAGASGIALRAKSRFRERPSRFGGAAPLSLFSAASPNSALHRTRTRNLPSPERYTSVRAGSSR